MNKNTLITSFSFTHYKFKETHTVGSVQLFEHPCIGYINKGTARFLYRGKNYYAAEGDLIYIAKGTKYYSVWTGTPEIDFYSVNFSFVKAYCFYDYRFRIIKNYPCDLFDNMHNSYNTDYYMSVSYMYRLLSDIYKHMTPETTAVSGKISVLPAIDYIEKNYNTPVSIDTLSKLCHSCSSGFFKLFKAETGVTPITYKHNIMIQNSLDLLAHTDLTIDEISAKTGFSSSNYFRKVFFEITGKTPKEVR